MIRLLKTCGELTIQRRTHRMSCMSILLEFANHYNTSIRIWALDQIVSIYSKLYSSTGPLFRHSYPHLGVFIGHLLHWHQIVKIYDVELR